MVIIKHLGLIYKAMNKYDEAENLYMEALKNCQLSLERAEVLQELEGLRVLRLPASY